MQVESEYYNRIVSDTHDNLNKFISHYKSNNIWSDFDLLVFILIELIKECGRVEDKQFTKTLLYTIEDDFIRSMLSLYVNSITEELYKRDGNITYKALHDIYDFMLFLPKADMMGLYDNDNSADIESAIDKNEKRIIIRDEEFYITYNFTRAPKVNKKDVLEELTENGSTGNEVLVYSQFVRNNENKTRTEFHFTMNLDTYFVSGNNIKASNALEEIILETMFYNTTSAICDTYWGILFNILSTYTGIKNEEINNQWVNFIQSLGRKI